jgi:hypothetical protein
MFKARIVLYSRGKENMVLTFNAERTSNMNWFTDGNLQSSPWQDIHNTSKNFFDLIGYHIPPSSFRNFYINYLHGGCEIDAGWLSIGNTMACAWESRNKMPSFLYSNKTTAVTWNDFGEYPCWHFSKI